jgi:hypothetical protein
MLAKKAPSAPIARAAAPLYREIRAVLEEARAGAYRAVNTVMVQAYWHVGRLIVEHEQGGKRRAAYGEAVLEDLSRRLTDEFGRGFTVRNLRNMRQFFECFRIRHAVRAESGDPKQGAPRLESGGTSRKRYAARAEAGPFVLLRCFVLIDLKVGALTHQDIGQMDGYVRVFDARARLKDDNPTIGLILCSKKNEAIARYSVLSEGKRLFAAKYVKVLPSEAELQRRIERERKRIEASRPGGKEKP